MVKCVVSAALLLLLVARAGLGHLGRSLRSIDSGWLAAGLVLGVAAAMLQANQWRGLLNAFGLRVRYVRCLRLDTAARFFDAALPSNIGGDVIRVRLATRTREELSAAALAVALRRVMSVPGLLLLISLGLLSSWSLPYASRARAISLACLLGGIGVTVLVFGAYRLRHLARIRLPRPARKLQATLAAVRAGSLGTADRHPIWRASVRGLIFWIAVVLSQACYIRAVHLDPPVGYTVAVVTCVNALSMLPISVGGYGVREGVFSALLGVAGVGTAAQGAAVGVCLSAQTLLFGLVGAAVYVISIRTRREAADDPTAAAAPGVATELSLEST